MTSSYGQGHRQRLRERLLKAGDTALADYELLEMILFLSHPRGDVKPLAKELLKRFSSIGGIFQVPVEELQQLKGLGATSAATFQVIKAITSRIAREELVSRPILPNSEQFIRYCRLRIQDMKIEQFQVFFLNKKMQLLADEVHQRGTLDHTAVYPRELIKQALYYGASHLLLAHNHPSGDCTPSQDDLKLTKYIMSAGEKLGIYVQDHVIISAANHFSMKTEGFI